MKSFTFPRTREWIRGVNERMSAAERMSKASRVEQANEWAVWANGWAREPVLTSQFLAVIYNFGLTWYSLSQWSKKTPKLWGTPMLTTRWMWAMKVNTHDQKLSTAKLKHGRWRFINSKYVRDMMTLSTAWTLMYRISLRLSSRSSLHEVWIKFFLDASAHLYKRSCPSGCPSPIILKRWIWMFLRVKSRRLIYGVDQKKVNLVLDQLKRCGFLHGVQDVSNNTSIVILDIAKFWLFLLFVLEHVHKQ